MAFGKKELIEQRQQALDELFNLREVMDTEKRDLNADENVKWEACNADIEQSERSISQLDELAKHEDKQIDSHIVADRKAGSVSEDDRVLAVNAWSREMAGLDISDEMRSAKERVSLKTNANTIDFRMFANAPKSMSDIEKRAGSSLVGSLGGYTCPVGFVSNLEKALLNFGSMRPLASILRTANGNDLEIPMNNDTSNSGSWVGQNSDMSSGTDAAYTNTLLKAHKVSSKVILLPLELLEDSAFDILNYTSELAGERIARSEESAFATGTGVAQPTGVITDSYLGVTAASATAITADEIIDLAHSVDPSYRNMPSTAFMMHDTIIKAIRKLKGGDGQYMWQPGLQAGIPSILYGFPVAINQSANSSLTTGVKTMLFGDFSKYQIRDVSSLSMQILRERYAEYGQVGVLVTMRVDGKLINAGTNPIKHLIQL